MQEKLFLNDSYLKECMSNLVDVTDTGGLIFDKTIFFPYLSKIDLPNLGIMEPDVN